MFAVQRWVRGSTPVARPCRKRHLERSAHAQGYFSATIWCSWPSRVLPCQAAIAAKRSSPGAQICVDASLVLSGTLRKRVAADGSAALIRLS